MKVLIEDFKSNYKKLGEECDNQYKKINALLLKGKDVTKAREGYTEKWNEFNKQTDFITANGINFWTNFGNKTIEYN